MRLLVFCHLIVCSLVFSNGSLAAASEPWLIHTDAAHLRSGPDRNAQIITTLPKGARVVPLQQSGRYTQVKVIRTGVVGWVYALAQSWPELAALQPEHAVATASGGEIKVQLTLAQLWPELAASQPEHAVAIASGAETKVQLIPPPAISDAASSINAEDVYLEMNKLDAQVLYRKDPHDYSSFPVSVAEGEQRLFGQVEVKGSFSRNFLKKSILIKLDKGATWHGQRRISLNAMATDPVMMRDWLAWDLIHRLGMVGPEVRYVRLFINNEYIGMYTYVEWIGNQVFERYGLGTDDEFYQPNDQYYCGNLTLEMMPHFDQCWDKLSPQDKDLSRLRALAEQINATPVEQFDQLIEKQFDVDSVVNWLLVNTLTSNGDTYNKNYFLLYSKKTEKWFVIPWDYDLSFGRVADNALPYPVSVYNDYFQYQLTPELGAANPLKEKTLKNPKLLQRYKKRLASLLSADSAGTSNRAQGWFHPAQFGKMIDSLEHFIGPKLDGEKYPNHKAGDFKVYVDALRYYNEWRYHMLYKMFVQPTVFNTPLWLPYTSYAPFTPLTDSDMLKRRKLPFTMLATSTMALPDQKIFFVDDQFGRPLASITPRRITKPAKITVEVAAEQIPDDVPINLSSNQCIERTWFIISKKLTEMLVVDIQLDYLQESSVRHELGAGIHDERKLRLWHNDGEGWEILPTSVNSITNMLKTNELQLFPGKMQRLVACTE